MADNKTIGERIKKARDAIGLSLAEFAGPVKIDTSRFSKIERGIEGIGLPQIIALAEKHRINIMFLVTGQGEILQNGPDNHGPTDPKSHLDFSAQQLFHMYLKTAERQDVIIEGQTAILKNIESKMAREETLAKLQSNSIEILAGVRSLSKRQKMIMADLQLQSQKVHRLPGSGKNQRQNGGATEKPGKTK